MDEDCIRSLTEDGLRRMIQTTVEQFETARRNFLEAQELFHRLNDEEKRREELAQFKMDKRTV